MSLVSQVGLSKDCALHSVQHRFEIGTEDVLARLIGSKIELIKCKEKRPPSVRDLSKDCATSIRNWRWICNNIAYELVLDRTSYRTTF